MRKDLKIGLLAVGALVLFIVIYLIIRHEKYGKCILAHMQQLPGSAPDPCSTYKEAIQCMDAKPGTVTYKGKKYKYTGCDWTEDYQAAIGALRPSYPGEYEDIGGVPRGLGWV